jgi:hypothetical protein
VPPGSGTRFGVDRDEDGAFDRDELDQCSDPTDGQNTPAIGCVGDCDRNCGVSIDELVRGVNIGLGAAVDQCRAFDRDINGEVAVAELIEGVGNSLQGCLHL